jgi:hypothetical protein
VIALPPGGAGGGVLSVAPVLPPGFPPAGPQPPQSAEDREQDAKSLELVFKLKDVTDQAARKTAIAELTEVVTNQFNARQKQREQELKQLEEQLKKLRSIQERREAARDEIIADRVRQLIKESEGLNWGSGSIGTTPGRVYATEHAHVWGHRTPGVTTEPLYSPAPKPPGNMAVVRYTEGLKKTGDEIRFFSIAGFEGMPADLITVVETLLDNAQRDQITLTSFGNKIICKGTPEAVKQVESIMQQLLENAPSGKGVPVKDPVPKR